MCQNIEKDDFTIVEKIIAGSIFLLIVILFLYWISGSIYYFFQGDMDKGIIHFCLFPFMAVLCALLMGACGGIQD